MRLGRAGGNPACTFPQRDIGQRLCRWHDLSAIPQLLDAICNGHVAQDLAQQGSNFSYFPILRRQRPRRGLCIVSHGVNASIDTKANKQRVPPYAD